jgi:hypothetical protein
MAMKDKRLKTYATCAMKQVIMKYVDCGWLDANVAVPSIGHIRPAFLLLASWMRVYPQSEVLITERCHQTFKGTRLIVSDTSRRFDLVDLKIGFRSQFRRAERLALGSCLGEAAPELIRWPLEVCGEGGEISVSAIIPAQEARGDADPGEAFEMLLLGEVL